MQARKAQFERDSATKEEAREQKQAAVYANKKAVELVVEQPLDIEFKLEEVRKQKQDKYKKESGKSKGQGKYQEQDKFK